MIVLDELFFFFFFKQENSDSGTESQRSTFYVFFHLTSDDTVLQSMQDKVKFIHQETKCISSTERFFDITDLHCTMISKLI